MLMVYFSMDLNLSSGNILINLKTKLFYCISSNYILNDCAALMKAYAYLIIISFYLFFFLFNKLFYNLDLQVF